MDRVARDVRTQSRMRGTQRHRPSRRRGPAGPSGSSGWFAPRSPAADMAPDSFCDGHVGGEPVHPDPVRGEFECRGLGEVDDAGLRRGVRGISRRGAKTLDRRDVDDAATALWRRPWPAPLAGCTASRASDWTGSARPSRSGLVSSSEDQKTPPALFTRIVGTPSVSTVAVSAASTWSASRTSVTHASPPVSAAADSAVVAILLPDRDLGAELGERGSDATADARATAGDHRHAVVQRHGVASPTPWVRLSRSRARGNRRSPPACAPRLSPGKAT